MPTVCQRGSSFSWGFGRCRSGKLAVQFSFMGLSVPIPRPLPLFLCWRSLSSARSSGWSSPKPRYRLVSQKKYRNPAAVTHRPNAIAASWKPSSFFLAQDRNFFLRGIAIFTCAGSQLFLARDQSGQIPCGQMGPCCPLRKLIRTQDIPILSYMGTIELLETR